MSYEKDIIIDDSSLDVEWLEQPSLMMKYARISAQTRRILDESKQNLDVVKAELDKDIRENPDDYGIGKITEGAITSAINTADEYKNAFKSYLDAKYETDMAQGAVRAFDARKDALENLVRLHGQQYFAGPKIPRDLAWERKEKEKKTDKGVASKLTRNKQ